MATRRTPPAAAPLTPARRIVSQTVLSDEILRQLGPAAHGWMLTDLRDEPSEAQPPVDPQPSSAAAAPAAEPSPTAP